MYVDAALIVLLLSASALCIFLIFYFKKITQSIVQMQSDLNKVSNQITPLINSIHNLSNSLTEVVNELKEQADKTKWVIDQLKLKVEQFLSFEKKVVETVESPVNSLMNNLKSIKAGISTFWNSYKKR